MIESPLILVVDDEENFRDIISALLGASGFRIATASNGEEALVHAEELKPDLIILDMKMPGMDGAATFAKLKEKDNLKDMKVLFLSSFGDPRAESRVADQHLAQEVGALDYVNKTDLDTKLLPKVKEIFS